MDDSTGAAQYLHADLLGTPRLITNAAGDAVGAVSYDAFGNRTTQSGIQSAFGFTGNLVDELTGLLYLRARDYDAATGQFLTVDPAVDSTRQPYAYAGNSPVSRTDPSGLQWCDGCTLGENILLSDPLLAVGDFLKPAENSLAGLGDGASFGLTELAREANGTNCRIEKDGWYWTEYTLGAIGSTVTGGAVLAGGLKLIQSARAIFMSGAILRATNMGHTAQLAAATAHLESIGAASIAQNAAMLARVEEAIAQGRNLTVAESNFLLHEATEAEAVALGLSQDAAHALAGQTHPPYTNYDPAVILELKEWFSPNWLKAWGING